MRSSGSANTTAVADTDAVEETFAISAPAGRTRAGAAAFALGFTGRRTGANASAADHPVKYTTSRKVASRREVVRSHGKERREVFNTNGLKRF